MEPAVTAFFDKATNMITYIVADPATAEAAIVACVLDFNPKSARTSTSSAYRLIEAVRWQDLDVERILDLSAALISKTSSGAAECARRNARAILELTYPY